MHRAYIYLPGEDREIYEALRVEADREIPRTKVNIEKNEEIIIEIIAEDTHALRAAINSYLRWIELSYNIMEVIEYGRTQP
ncbi:hypothetical protein B6U71_00490 [Euryarchaeota archaeon ex4484_178]|nr:MAG: hypothetical protein B6U71_00490 [Euryarchaeota archaeon ex4484_178]